MAAREQHLSYRLQASIAGFVTSWLPRTHDGSGQVSRIQHNWIWRYSTWNPCVRCREWRWCGGALLGRHWCEGWTSLISLASLTNLLELDWVGLDWIGLGWTGLDWFPPFFSFPLVLSLLSLLSSFLNFCCFPACKGMPMDQHIKAHEYDHESCR